MFGAFVAALLITLASLAGVFVFGKQGGITGTHRYILPVAVGVFLGVIFFELIPGTLALSAAWGPTAIAVGFLGFYLLSHFLSTYHHHHERESHDGCIGAGARLLLIGDAVHNIADGVVLGISFLIDPALGVAVALGIALHEIPQEIAEFGVLLQSGYTKRQAAFYNLLSASSILFGILLVALFAQHLSAWLFALTGVAAGNLLYLATADLIPELRETHSSHFWKTFLSTVLGLVFIAGLLFLSHALVEKDVVSTKTAEPSVHKLAVSLNI